MEFKQKNYKQCDICKVDEASSLCPQCFNYYCDSCYKAVHDKGKNNVYQNSLIGL